MAQQHAQADLRLDKVEREDLVKVVERRIINAIQTQELKPGDRLPTELELSEQLAVSRSAVREALRGLRVMGLLDSRRRRGMVLQEPAVFDSMKKALDFPMMISDSSRKELMEMRYVIEVGMADLICARITDEDIKQLQLIVRREMSAPADQELAIECDLAFHSKLYSLTGNQSLEKFQNLLARFLDEVRDTFFWPTRYEAKDAVNHRELCHCLKLRDPDVYRNAMKKHLSHLLPQGAVDLSKEPS